MQFSNGKRGNIHFTLFYAKDIKDNTFVRCQLLPKKVYERKRLLLTIHRMCALIFYHGNDSMKTKLKFVK